MEKAKSKSVKIFLVILSALLLIAFMPAAGISAQAKSKRIGAPKYAHVSVKYSVKKKKGGRLVLSWDRATGASSYVVTLYKKSGKKYKKYGSHKYTPKTSTTVSVSKNGTFKYKVKGIKGKRSGKAKSSRSIKVKNTIYGWKLPKITKQPVNQVSANPYTTPSFKFSLTATGTKISYQWYRISNGKATAVSGATKSSYTADNTGSYYCIVKSKAGSVKSNTVKGTVSSLDLFRIQNGGDNLRTYYTASHSDYIFSFNTVKIQGSKSWTIHASDYKNGSTVKIKSQYKDGSAWYTTGAVFTYKVSGGKFVFSTVTFGK